MRATRLILSILGLSSLASAAPQASAHGRKEGRRYFVERDGTNYTVFEQGDVTLQFVTNSGICETTPGVNQYSGYLSVGTNMNMWFWFFESRNSPTTAPLATWFNGGPGCSSMIGLFQENGPCMFKNGASTPSLNPYSWNNYANMLYIDQPIGTGFSYGTNQVTSTVTAAPFVWSFLQAFYAAFPQYKSRDFGIFTESYGGHYGPQFASYIQSQNAKIDAGTANGDKVNIVALGINNGWIDAILQYPGYVEFAANNSYRRIINSSKYTSYMSAFNSRCLPQLRRCTATTGQNSQCTAADNACYSAIWDPLTGEADFNVYDVRVPSNDPNPPQTYVNYLQTRSVMTAIGAQSTYQECPDAPYEKFVATGDDPRSFLGVLSSVVQSNVTVLIWAGDADFTCNWVGNLAAVNAIQYSGSSAFANKAVAPYTVNGVSKGEYKTVGNLSWLKVYNAGHEVPFYQPEAALQVFVQAMSKQPLAST